MVAKTQGGDVEFAVGAYTHFTDIGKYAQDAYSLAATTHVTSQPPFKTAVSRSAAMLVDQDENNIHCASL